MQRANAPRFTEDYIIPPHQKTSIQNSGFGSNLMALDDDWGLIKENHNLSNVIDDSRQRGVEYPNIVGNRTYFSPLKFNSPYSALENNNTNSEELINESEKLDILKESDAIRKSMFDAIAGVNNFITAKKQPKIPFLQPTYKNNSLHLSNTIADPLKRINFFDSRADSRYGYGRIYGGASMNGSATTENMEWAVPRVMIQTKTTEGFGEKSDRHIFEYQDSKGLGLSRISSTIAPDMQYGNGTTHNGGFVLSDIKDESVLENINKLSKCSDDELFELFGNLVGNTSMGALDYHNLELVKHFKNQTYAHGAEHEDYRLTEAAFAHPSTVKFIKDVTYAFKAEIAHEKGDVNNANMEDWLESADNTIVLKRPVFVGKMDYIKGLKIAINDTWGFRVTLTKYSFNSETKEVEAVLKYRIFDHFGLDVYDVESFGSIDEIIGVITDRLPVKVNIDERTLGYILAQSFDKVNAQPVKGAPYYMVKNAANGFCAWFILQHLRGYKPFITVMEKEETIKFRYDEI